MSYPDLVSPLVPLPLSDAPALLADIPSTYSPGQTFPLSSTQGWTEVNAAGAWTENPLGQSGPFLVVIDGEGILCSELSDAGVVTVWSAGSSNGRAYTGSSSAHPATSRVYLSETSAQDSSGGGGGGATTLSLSYNGVGPFDVPVASLPAGWAGSGVASMLAQLTTGPSLVTGLEDVNGNAIPDGWSFPAIIFVEGATIYDIVALNNYAPGIGGGFSWWGTSGGAASFALGSNGTSNPFNYGSNPNGSLTPTAQGDVVLDETTPAVWQAWNGSDTGWVALGDAPPVVAYLNVSANAVTVPVCKSARISNDAAASVDITLQAGTPYDAQDGQTLVVRFLDFSDVAQALTWDGTENSTVSVPSMSNGSTTEPLTVGFIYNGQTGHWRCVAVA